jgi:hypothetical protein
MHRAPSLILGLVAAGCGCTSLAGVDDWPRAGSGGGASAASSGAGGGSGGAGSGSGGAAGGSGGARGCVTPTATDLYAVTVLEDSPLGYWRLDESEGRIAKDEMGCNHGTYAGGVQTLRVGAVGAGTAVFLDGDGARIVLGDVLDFDGSAQFSLEAWIRPQLSTTDGKYRRIIDKGTVEPREGYFLEIHELELILERWSNNESDIAKFTNLSPISDGEYLHVVGTHDGNQLLLYLDGVEVAAGVANGIMPDLDVALVFGSNEADTNNFIGDLDEVAIYGHALSAERIAEHRSAGLAGR